MESFSGVELVELAGPAGAVLLTLWYQFRKFEKKFDEHIKENRRQHNRMFRRIDKLNQRVAKIEGKNK